MTELENIVYSQIKAFVPEFDSVKVTIRVSKKIYSLDFIAELNGEKIRCDTLLDDGTIKEKEFDKSAKFIADYIKSLPDYNSEKQNKYVLIIKDNK